MLEKVADRRIQEQILKRAEQLRADPEKQGKPLVAELAGYRSLRAAGERYRIVYQVVRSRVLVIVIGAGIRREGSSRDIYSLARRLIRSRLVE